MWIHGRGRTTEEMIGTDLVKCKISFFMLIYHDHDGWIQSPIGYD